MPFYSLPSSPSLNGFAQPFLQQKPPASPQAPHDEAPSLLAFTQQTYSRYKPAAHHLALADALERVERGELRRLMVFMPPRHGKSELASVRFPAWYLGKNPDRKVIAASYAAGLSYKFSRRARNLIASPAYQRLFPDVHLAGDAAAVQFWALQGHDGQYSAAGIGGGITGEGADLLIIDDPVKDAEGALSLTYREAAYEWYTSTAYTRLNDEAGAIVLIQTRWHEEDLAGKLLQEAADGGERWEVIRFPAIAEAGDALGRPEGQALWPERFDVDRLATIRRVQGENWWSALYQQTPPEAIGGRYFRMWSPTKDGQPYHVWPEAVARARYGVEAGQPFPPRHWLHWASVDGGYRDAWSTLFFARAPDRRIIAFREMYATNVAIPEQAQRILRVIRDEGVPVRRVLADPAMFATRANLAVSDAQVYAQQGLPLTRGTNSRAPGWRRVVEFLAERDDGYPGLVVLEGTCPNLVRTLPRMTADPDDPEDIEDGQEDHAVDSLRYGLMPAAAPDASRLVVPMQIIDPDAGGPSDVLGPGIESRF